MVRELPHIRLQFAKAVSNYHKAISVTCILAISLLATGADGQPSFVRVTDPANPIVSNGSTGNYTSCAWVDINSDGLLDLFVIGKTGNFLYYNQGGGTFVRDTTAAIAVAVSNYQGCSWADYDNDGDPDVFLSGGVAGLYRNDGGSFSEIPLADLGTVSVTCWSGTWADFDNDGYLDMVQTSPPSFAGGPRHNQLLRNLGPPDFHFEEIDTSIVETLQNFPTSANWSDFDLDGDMDIFIGCGPATGGAGADQIFRNMLKESGVPGFQQLKEAPLGTDPGDGQQWSLIDYDNDGDLDAFRTNWGLPNPAIRSNDLYRNDNGTYVAITTGAIVTDVVISLGNSWGDFDNDGDMDCFVANQNGVDSYYENNGDGTFTSITAGDIVGAAVSHWNGTAGDYDNDGDLDLFVSGVGAVGRSLLRNDIANTNGWLKVGLTGTLSNRSAVGARVRIKASIGGQPRWQMRELSVQNGFCGHNSTILHFGLGDATIIDSLIIEWPSGNRFDTTALTPNQYLSFVEKGISLGSTGPTLGHPPLSVTFDASGSGAISNLLWDFGDGTQSTETTPTHSFDAAGIFDVTLSVVADDGNFSVTYPNYVWVWDDTLSGSIVDARAGDKVVVDVSINNTFPIQQVLLPVQFGNGQVGINVDSVSTSGLRTQGLTSGQLLHIDPFNSRLAYRLTALPGEIIEPGSGPVLSLYLSVNSGDASDTTAITFDSYSSYTYAISSIRDGYAPTSRPGLVRIDPCLPGDVNDDGAGPDISDLTTLVGFMFKGGPPPPNPENANTDGVGDINIADVTYLVGFMFKAGPAPICPA